MCPIAKLVVLCRPSQKFRIRGKSAGYRVLSGLQIYVVSRVEQGHLGGARIISCLKWAVGQLLADIYSTRLNTGSTKNSKGSEAPVKGDYRLY